MVISEADVEVCMHDALELSRFTLGPFLENCYLLVGPSGKRAAVVDPGLESEVVLDEIRSRGLQLDWIINTHGHLDHVAGNRFFKEQTGAPIVIHEADAGFLEQLEQQGRMFGLSVLNSPPPDHHFIDGQPFLFDGVPLEVIHTPGHSPGGVCLRFGRRMLVGDTLFQGSIGRTDLPGGSLAQLVASIRDRLFTLPGETLCYPGHGDETTLQTEQRDNPFVSDRAVGAIGSLESR